MASWERIAQRAESQVEQLTEINTDLLAALESILNIALMDNGHWAKTIEAEASAAIAKAKGQ